ncbi:MAG: tetratricopeptide repeat protein [Gemmatimonadota bacterium]|nr:tetratricopeptide repeat protein [Gemmatimonadota bacterium]MDP6529607.1 tetratricopeptide repeat protein [Gemmatimonadota bacterium]
MRQSWSQKDGNPGRIGIALGIALLATLGVGVLLTTLDTASGPGESEQRPAVAESAPSSAAMPAEIAEVPESAPEVSAETAVAEPVVEPATFDGGMGAYGKGEYARAAAMFAAWGAEHPESVWGPYMRGVSLRHAGDLAGAEAALVVALSIDPGHRKSLLNLSRVLLDAGRPDDAFASVRNALDINPESGEALRVFGLVRHAQGDRGGALAAFEAALDADSTDAWSWNNAGFLFIEEERFVQARSCLEEACSLDDTQPTFWNNLGVARERVHDYDGAAGAYARAVELDSAYEKAILSLARVEAIPDSPEAPRPVEMVEQVETAESEKADEPVADGDALRSANAENAEDPMEIVASETAQDR